MKVLVVTPTPAGAAVADRLPYEQVSTSPDGPLADAWKRCDAVVWVAAVPSAAPPLTRLSGRHGDRPAVSVDESGTWVVPLADDDRGRAETLAVDVADRLDATAVIGADHGVTLLDRLDGFVATGDIEGVTVALLAGEQVDLVVDEDLVGWPRPAALDALAAGAIGKASVRVTDQVLEDSPRETALRPPSLVVGVAGRSETPVREVDDLLTAALAEAGLARESVGEVVTTSDLASEVSVLALGTPVRALPPERLAGADAESRAELAALAGSGADGEIVSAARTSGDMSLAVARRVRPRGHLALVGLGPGDPEHRTPAAAEAVRRAEVVVASGSDLEQVRDLVREGQEVLERLPGDERARVHHALAEAERGRRVALLCSGDAGVYSLASMACEVAVESHAEVEVVPGITAATSSAALLGAPLGHDFALISLSDALTPWDVIASRIRAAAEADLVTVFYNPRSGGRPDHLARARRILLEHRKPETPVGIVTDAFRPEEEITITDLGELDPTLVGMSTTVIVGSTTTAVVDGRMVTPPSYLP